MELSLNEAESIMESVEYFHGNNKTICQPEYTIRY